MGAPPLPRDPAAPLRPPPPPRPRHLTAAAEVAAGTAVSAKEGHQAGTGRKEKREVTAREEGVAEEGGTRRVRRRGGRGGAMKGGAGRPGAIGSIKIETGRTSDVKLVPTQPLRSTAGDHRKTLRGTKPPTIYLTTHEMMFLN